MWEQVKIGIALFKNDHTNVHYDSWSGRPSIVNAEQREKINDNDDFYLFPHVKTWLAKQHFDDDEEQYACARARLKCQAVKFFADGFNKIEQEN